MSIRDIAKHYSKWVETVALPDNAPRELHQFLRTMADTTAKYVVGDALRQLAGGKEPDPPPLRTLMYFFAEHSAAHPSLDEVMASKKPPGTYEELLQRAYRDHYQVVLSRVRKWLAARLDESNQ